MNASPDDTPGVEESLAAYFHKSAAVVRQYADLIEQNYAQPLLHIASSKLKEKPVTMTFISILSGLSLLPLLSFIGLTIFVFSSIAFLALACAAIAFLTIETVLVACLAFVLWSLLIVASFTTVVVFLVYRALRLGMLVTSEGPSGVTDWAHETRQYVFSVVKREASEESDESGVLVNGDNQFSKKVKVEEETLLEN